MGTECTFSTKIYTILYRAKSLFLWMAEHMYRSKVTFNPSKKWWRAIINSGSWNEPTRWCESHEDGKQVKVEDCCLVSEMLMIPKSWVPAILIQNLHLSRTISVFAFIVPGLSLSLSLLWINVCHFSEHLHTFDYAKVLKRLFFVVFKIPFVYSIQYETQNGIYHILCW